MCSAISTRYAKIRVTNRKGNFFLSHAMTLTKSFFPNQACLWGSYIKKGYRLRAVEGRFPHHPGTDSPKDLVTKILVPGSCYQDLGSQILVPGSWYQDLGTKILVARSWYQDLGTKILDSRSWYQDLGTKILVPGSSYQDLGTQKTESLRGGASQKLSEGARGAAALCQGFWEAGSPPGTAGGLVSGRPP